MIKNCKCCHNEFDATGRQLICPTCRKDNNAKKAKNWRQKNELTNIVVYKETADKIKTLLNDDETVYNFIKRVVDNYGIFDYRGF